MALLPHYDGPALVKVDAGQGGGLQSVGYTEDGVDVSTQGFFLDVHGDQNGGTDGPPIDIQFLGEIATVRLNLTKYDTAVVPLLLHRAPTGATTGTPGTTGTLLFTDVDGSSHPNYHRLLIATTNDPFNFPVAVPREAHEQNKGTKFKRFQTTYICYANSSGVLWNATTV